MSLIQPEGSKIRLQPACAVQIVVTMPAPRSLCTVSAPGGISISDSVQGRTRTFSFVAPYAPWSGTFLVAVAFVPNAGGSLDPTESFTLRVDDPTTPAVDIDISTIRPRPGNLNPIAFVLDFVV